MFVVVVVVPLLLLAASSVAGASAFVTGLERVVTVRVTVDLGRASRPSKMSVRRRSRKRMVSRTQRSSPYSAFSIESRMFDSRISLVIVCELRHSVERRPVRVDIETTAL